jgi:hypothetical protein
MEHRSDSQVVRISVLVSLLSGLGAAAAYYLLTRKAEAPTDELILLKEQLVKELREHDINPPKDEDYCFTMDFMVLLYKVLYTY